jgi:hypothetical protein
MKTMHGHHEQGAEYSKAKCRFYAEKTSCAIAAMDLLLRSKDLRLKIFLVIVELICVKDSEVP